MDLDNLCRCALIFIEHYLCDKAFTYTIITKDNSYLIEDSSYIHYFDDNVPCITKSRSAPFLQRNESTLGAYRTAASINPIDCVHV